MYPQSKHRAYQCPSYHELASTGDLWPHRLGVSFVRPMQSSPPQNGFPIPHPTLSSYASARLPVDCRKEPGLALKIEVGIPAGEPWRICHVAHLLEKRLEERVEPHDSLVPIDRPRAAESRFSSLVCTRAERKGRAGRKEC